MVIPSVPPERSRRDVPSVDHLREPSSFFPIALVTVVIFAFALVVLAGANRIDATVPAAHLLPTRCDVPTTQGDRLVVTFTLRGQVIDIVCRPIKDAIPAQPLKGSKS